MAELMSVRALRPAELAGFGRAQGRSWVREPSTYERVKRGFDLLAMLLLLPFVLPVLAVCALAIRLESRGPLLISERCTGRGGRPFRRYRLRTTRVDAGAGSVRDCGGGRVRPDRELANAADATYVGRALRGLRLDGLPQLLNVLRGEMSLVGPLPTCHAFDIKPLWYTARFDVRPGLVSAGLVSGTTSLESEECLRVDIAYIRAQAIGLDLWILIQAAGIAARSARYPIKRAMDVSLVTVMMVVFAPILLGVGGAIRVSSPGPVLFRQTRMGRNGRPFQIFKFRTMRVDAEAMLRADPALYQAYVENDYKLSLDEDPRIFPLGRWLRRTSLDELPQLLNVLRGEMSLVGPRPLVPAELEHYQERAAVLLSVLPGITGAWQVSGRSHIRYPERCDVELAYVRSWSLRQDVVILARTVSITLSGRGAT